MNALMTRFKAGPAIRLILLIAIASSMMGGPLRAAASDLSAWGANYFPNVQLTTQDGEQVRFYDDLIKNKLFAINFIYTRCTAACPMETAALRNLQKALGEHMGKDIMFYTISIDGDSDRPAELKQYADKFHVGPGWMFLTGKAEDVTLLRQKLGMYRADGQAEQSLSEHSVHILLGNEATGMWIKRSPFDETKALLRVITERLQPSMAGQAIRVAGRAAAQSRGESLFRGQCEACHNPGSEDGLGPALSGVVAKRDRAWLKRWIQQPDQMIAEQDATAIELYQRYNQLPMPNLKLGDVDVEAIIDYLESLGGMAKTRNGVATPS